MKKKVWLILVVMFGAAWLLQTPLQAAETAVENKKEIVVLLHGLGRSNVAMWRLANLLEDAGYDVKQVGYSSFNTTTPEVVSDITKQIDDCCVNQNRTVHFVGHSLGGLLIRAYLQDNRLQHLGRTVLIGTPNNGTDIADRFRGNCLVEFLMPMATALGTDDNSLPKKLDAPYYTIGVIAGVTESDSNEDYLPGRDDGLVPVESTKLEGMTDFIEVNSGHSMMRYNNEVAEQTIYFLKNGQFNKVNSDKL
ncbi:alpha/beta fold hydrolase [Thiomicrorhabdus lithotrophica]|uniref:Alpha/beta fold hydrolase n=1 Tax=Thiomicrorhabdus lithotrophica TaxID=2949997 RepID=A0ABY8CAN7_9GAMM|nr:alpha/beta fold hydrolase [Thiomicrorhabdus lithotrophica]WEJ63039.1 alpha/beta fold hydrolase [Thiomicrorhabdus lithotrophica]